MSGEDKKKRGTTPNPELVKLFDEQANIFAQALGGDKLRGEVLTCASNLENDLGDLLTAVLAKTGKPSNDLRKQLFESRGALSGLSDRINMARALGLILGPTANDMHRVRAIRNYFAHHSGNPTFNDKKIEKAAAALENNFFNAAKTKQFALKHLITKGEERRAAVFFFCLAICITLKGMAKDIADPTHKIQIHAVSGKFRKLWFE